MPGLRDLLDRLREQRQQQLQRYDLGSIMDDIKQQLEQVLQTERGGIEWHREEHAVDRIHQVAARQITCVAAACQKRFAIAGRQRLDDEPEWP